MKALFFAATALTFIATPAQAQLLGGSGGLSGSIGGTIGTANDTTSPIRSTTRTVRSTTDSVQSATRGSVNGDATTDGSQNVNRRNGSVSADRNADAGLTGGVSHYTTNPITPFGGNASGRGQASGNGNAEAQLIGTDSVGSLTNSSASRVQNTAGSARDRARSAAGQTQDSVGGLSSAATNGISGNASGEGNGSGSFTSMPLAVAGSGAAMGQGAFGVAPGMPVFAPSGERIGKVREVVANNRGEIQQVLVAGKGTRTLIPADQFAASGNALVLGSGEGEISKGSSEPDPQNSGNITAAQ